MKNGDVGPYEYLVSKYMKRVVSIAWGIVRNAADAEDLAQEAFVRAFQTIDRFETLRQHIDYIGIELDPRDEDSEAGCGQRGHAKPDKHASLRHDARDQITHPHT